MALGYSDSVLVMDSGQVMGQGTPAEILPTLMNALRPEAWPDVLRLSYMLHKEFPSVPLTWDGDGLVRIVLNFIGQK
jgi:ABC-type glutathione transport system ATPase component